MLSVPEKTVYDLLKFLSENMGHIKTLDLRSRQKIGECEACIDDILRLLGFHEELPAPLPIRLCKAGELHTKR